MRKLKLAKGLSYAMKGFSCTNSSVVEVEDGQAETLLETGRFEEISGPVPEPEPGEKELSADDIDGMKKSQLLALAAQHGINIEDCQNNEERAERIKGALGLASFAEMGMED